MSLMENQPTIVQQSVAQTKQRLFSEIRNEQEGKKILQQLRKQQQQSLKVKRQPQPKILERIELSEQNFFTVMDLVDEYDKLLKQMNDQYCAGMMLIANVKFINPYSSLSTKGYKPTPAITKISIKNQQSSLQKQKQNLFTLVQQTKNIKFTNSIIDSINSQIQSHKIQHNINENQNENEEIDSQSAHSSMSTANQLYSYQEQELIMEEQQVIDQCNKLTESEHFSLQDFIIQRFSIQNQKPMVQQASTKFQSLLKKLLHLAEQKIQILKKFNSIEKQIQ